MKKYVAGCLIFFVGSVFPMQPTNYLEWIAKELKWEIITQIAKQNSEKGAQTFGIIRQLSHMMNASFTYEDLWRLTQLETDHIKQWCLIKFLRLRSEQFCTLTQQKKEFHQLGKFISILVHNIHGRYGYVKKPLTAAINDQNMLAIHALCNKIFQYHLFTKQYIRGIEYPNTPKGAHLPFAIKHKNKDMVALLIEHGADVNYSVKNTFGSPLNLAIAHNCYDIVLLLLDHGALIDKDKMSLHPLHYAASFGHTNLMKLLLSKHHNVNVRTLDKRTPLHYASKYNKLEAVQILLAHKANPLCVDKQRNTPLHLLAENQHPFLGIADLLFANQISINAKNKHGQTALHIAAQRSSSPFVQWLIKHGANTNAKDKDKITPKEYALVKMKIEVYNALTMKGH